MAKLQPRHMPGHQQHKSCRKGEVSRKHFPSKQCRPMAPHPRVKQFALQPGVHNPDYRLEHHWSISQHEGVSSLSHESHFWVTKPLKCLYRDRETQVGLLRAAHKEM